MTDLQALSIAMPVTAALIGAGAALSAKIKNTFIGSSECLRIHSGLDRTIERLEKKIDLLLSKRIGD